VKEGIAIRKGAALLVMMLVLLLLGGGLPPPPPLLLLLMVFVEVRRSNRRLAAGYYSGRIQAALPWACIPPLGACPLGHGWPVSLKRGNACMYVKRERVLFCLCFFWHGHTHTHVSRGREPLQSGSSVVCGAV
jgi:hypothetical protein